MEVILVFDSEEERQRYNLLLWCRKKCNNPLLVDELDFSMVLDNLAVIAGRSGISSESIGDLSQSFSGESTREVMDLLSPYRKAKFL